MIATSDNIVDLSKRWEELSRGLDGLADMSVADYGRKRKQISEASGIPLKYLDREYDKRSRPTESDGGADALPAPLEPWENPVDGVGLLDDLRDVVKRHLVLPSGAAETISLWVLFTHAHDCFEISPVLAATSPAPECGKTTLLTLLGELVPSPLPASNITGPALFRAVEKWSPTVLIDEADTFLRDSDELRGILNSGHNKRNAWVVRTQGDDYEPRRFSTWAPKAVALIGKLPPTLSSRSLHIRLQRKLATDQVTPLRGDKLAHLVPLHRKAARWALDNIESLASSDPRMPRELQSRMADNWRPLLAVADLAGDHWPETARKIAKAAALAVRDDVAAIQLLADIKGIFEQRNVDRLHSDDIISDLVVMEDKPWPEWSKGKPMTPSQMAKLLKGFEIAPKQMKIVGENKNGYEQSTLKPAFSRYLASTCLPSAENQGFAGDSNFYPGAETVDPKKLGNPQKSAKGRQVDPWLEVSGNCTACDGRGCPHCTPEAFGLPPKIKSS